METNILKYMAFVESVRHGSFTKAAETLGCSQSGVSRMVADLEHDWNVKLMERGRNGIELTPEGRDLFGYASDLCGSYDSLRSRVEEINGLDIHVTKIEDRRIEEAIVRKMPPEEIAEGEKDDSGKDKDEE